MKFIQTDGTILVFATYYLLIRMTILLFYYFFHFLYHVHCARRLLSAEAASVFFASPSCLSLLHVPWFCLGSRVTSCLKKYYY